MIEYQIRILGSNGGLRWRITLFCPDDDSARDYARQVVDGYDLELWEGERKIETFKQTHHWIG